MDGKLEKNQRVEKRFRFAPGEGEVKEPSEDEDEKTQIRLPVSSTAEDRDGDEFSREGLEDMKDQIESGKVPMFLDHGRGADGPFYGTLGIVGRWDSAEIETDGDNDVLFATGTPASTEPAEKMVQLIQDDMPVGSSVGFRVLEYERDEEENKYRFHGVDLLEISQVGIPSNPETVNNGDEVGAIGAKGWGETSAILGELKEIKQALSEQSETTVEIDSRELNDERPELGEDVSDDAFDAYLLSVGINPRDISDADKSRYKENITEMAEDTEGGDNSANDDSEVLEAVREQTESNRELTESIESLADSLGEEKNTEDEEEKDTGSEETESESEEKDTEPDAPEDALTLFVGDDADEGVQKEFEGLKEHANESGEVDLAESETRLFGEVEESDDDSSNSGPDGALI